MEPFAEGLIGRAQVWILTATSIHGENRRTSETEDMVVLEVLHNLRMHLTELTTMTFVENQNDMLAIDLVTGVLRNEIV